MEIGEKIKVLREQRSMTLEELGNKVGVGKSTVRKWENGMIANMRRDKIAKLANALQCSPTYLMRWDEQNSDSLSQEQPENSTLIIDDNLKKFMLQIYKLPLSIDDLNEIYTYAQFIKSKKKG